MTRLLSDLANSSPVAAPPDINLLAWLCSTRSHEIEFALTGLSPEAPCERRLECLDYVVAAQNGDLDAAAKLIERYRGRIASYVYAIVLNASDLDDVTQLVFVKMCSRISTLRDPALFEPWLYQIARRVSLDYLRRQKFKKWWCTLDALVHEPVEEAPQPEVRGVGVEDVQRVLNQLGTRDRQIIVLASEGHSYTEIARLLGASRGAIKARLGRVRDYVRSQLE